MIAVSHVWCVTISPYSRNQKWRINTSLVNGWSQAKPNRMKLARITEFFFDIGLSVSVTRPQKVTMSSHMWLKIDGWRQGSSRCFRTTVKQKWDNSFSIASIWSDIYFAWKPIGSRTLSTSCSANWTYVPITQLAQSSFPRSWTKSGVVNQRLFLFVVPWYKVIQLRWLDAI